MIIKKQDVSSGSFVQFSPYVTFIITYCFLYLYVAMMSRSVQNSALLLTGIPLFAVFIAIIQAFFTFQKSISLDEKIEIFLHKLAQSSILYDCFLIIYLSTFNHYMAKTNGIVTAVTLALLYIPTKLMLPILFLIAALVSIIITNLSVAIIILLPIGYSIAVSLQNNPALIAATIISGALCGNHLLNYFYTRVESLSFNIKHFFYHIQATTFVLIAPILGTLIMLSQHTCTPLSLNIYTHLYHSLHLYDYITIVPYAILIASRFFNINICISLIQGIIVALMIQIFVYKIMIIDVITRIFEGFYTEPIMIKILLLHIMMTALVQIIQHNQGFDWILQKLFLKSEKESKDLPIKALIKTILNNIYTIIDTQQIIKIEKQSDISTNHNIIMLSNMITPTIQTIIPYGSILFLATHIYKCSYVSIMHYMIYPITAMIIILFVSIPDKIDRPAK